MVVFDEPFDPLEDEIKVCDDVAVFIVDEIFQLLFDECHKGLIVGYPRLCLSQELPIICFLDESMRKLPFALSREASN